jgi:hypothetical protein
MPFDARQPCAEVRVIDKALELLGPNGEHWTQGISKDREGNRCIMGAVRSAKRMLRIKGDQTIRIILTALGGDPRYRPIDIIIDYNDSDREFEEIAALLAHARNIAARRC